MSAERLQKVLAGAGVASRRDCEELITSGRVTVNGRVVFELGTRVDLSHDLVAVDGKPVQQPDARTYILLNKPVGVVSTVDDPQGRPAVVDLVDVSARVFPVGRLDVDSEGLLLLTDDGELTHRLTHPSFAVEKEYQVLLDRAPEAHALREWRKGVVLDGERTAPAWAEVLERGDEGTWLRVVLQEGRKRQIREVARVLGYDVLRLIRVREGCLLLGDLTPGQWRHLRAEEVEELRAHAALSASDQTAELAPSPNPPAPGLPDHARSPDAAPRRKTAVPPPGDGLSAEPGERRARRPQITYAPQEPGHGADDEPEQGNRYLPKEDQPRRSRSRAAEQPASDRRASSQSWRDQPARDDRERSRERRAEQSGRERSGRDGTFGNDRAPSYGENRSSGSRRDNQASAERRSYNTRRDATTRGDSDPYNKRRDQRSRGDNHAYEGRYSEQKRSDSQPYGRRRDDAASRERRFSDRRDNKSRGEGNYAGRRDERATTGSGTQRRRDEGSFAGRRSDRQHEGERGYRSERQPRNENQRRDMGGGQNRPAKPAVEEKSGPGRAWRERQDEAAQVRKDRMTARISRPGRTKFRSRVEGRPNFPLSRKREQPNDDDES